MNYLESLGFSREPFSNSPDPLAFFSSQRQELCYHRLEISIRLKRGLNVVIGDIGTGKSTICRRLLRSFDETGDISANLILDPGFGSADELAACLHEMFAGRPPAPGLGRRAIMEGVKNATFKAAAEEGRILALLIDEGQKLSPECIELLRELLNFETNTEKLLQIVIFGQLELIDTINSMPNFKDRISELLTLRPFQLRETIRLVRHRLRLAGGPAATRLFTLPGLIAVHRATGGYPRRIMHLCHKVLLTLLIQNRKRAGWRLVRVCADRDQAETAQAVRPGRRVPTLVYAMALLAVVAALLANGPRLTLSLPELAHNIASRISALLGEQSTGSAQVRHPVHNQPEPLRDAVPEMSPQAAAAAVRPAPEHAAPLLAPPLTLGSVPLRPGDAVSRLTERIYGRSRGLLRIVAEANPAIPDLSRVATGTMIAFPAIPFEPPQAFRSGRFLQFGESDSLDGALDLVRGTPDRLDMLQVVSVWSPEQGLRHLVIFPQAFADDASALEALTRFAPHIGLAGTVRPGFGPGTLVFHDLVPN